MIIGFIFIGYFLNVIYQLTCSIKNEVLFKINCYLRLINSITQGCHLFLNMHSPWTHERRYGESKTKCGEYIVYYEESTFVVEIVHPIQYV